MNAINHELRLNQFEDTLDALIEMKEQARSESEDDRIDDEISTLILRIDDEISILILRYVG